MKHLGITTLALPDFGSFARQPRSRRARTDDRSTGACPELSLTRVALTVTPPAREARVGAVVGGARLHGKLPPRAAYVLMASIIGLALFTSGTPSPLYQTYRALWGFSSVVLTLVYATYAFGVLASFAAGRDRLRSSWSPAGPHRRAYSPDADDCRVHGR